MLNLIIRSLCLLILSTGSSSAAPSFTAIAVIVNKSNNVSNLSLRDIARIYQGELLKWPNGQRLHIINRPEQSELRKRFYQQVLNAKPSQKFYLSGSPVPMKTMEVHSDLSTRKLTNAIAYIPENALDDGVKVVAIISQEAEYNYVD